MNIQKLPNNYEPYERLVVCNNELIRCKAIIDHKGFYPILIGKGIFPKIWIYSKYSRYNEEIISLVEQSISCNPRMKVDIDPDKNLITIRFLEYQGIKDDIILNINYQKISAIIDILDLRPIGYTIYGTSKSIVAGEAEFSENKMIGMNAMFSI